MNPQHRIGISGWQYAGWRGKFYPSQLPQRLELAYASRVLNSIEINSTFYSLKRPGIFDHWRDQTPDDFVFAVKASRYITHTLRLRESAQALANFLANGLLKLDHKLGPILWQLPPRMQWEPDVVARFCDLLPTTMRKAATLAANHDERVDHKAWFDTDSRQPVRHAFEIRDPRMMNEKLIRILHNAGHTLVFADSAGRYPYAEEITSDLIYLRLHGADQMYVSRYDGPPLDWWQQRITAWGQGQTLPDSPRMTRLRPPRKPRDVFVYFDNDVKVHAPFDAIALLQRLNLRDQIKPISLADKVYPPPPDLPQDPASRQAA